MVTYIFELHGCTPKNLAGVQGSLVNTLNHSIHKTAQNLYLLRVEADTSPESHLVSVLSSIKVVPILATQVKPILVGSGLI